ncbi:cytochrome c oxidase subunit VIa [Patellaria atrata CBS 101060]|uniref:Cytochrome c oxidase subunit n=1 Tax=Patellaria atrata CBS 101060 TaxID=1346257 RepID=A0A9P4VN89_9PEZI|nr:cytochrome c oxidase subunit VIa [Patellaria atrata CBS 101060]
MISRNLFGRPPLRAIRIPPLRTVIRRTYASELTGVQDNAFNRERAAVKHHAEQTSDTWRKLSIYAVIPAIIIAGANAWVLWNEHWEHFAHGPPLEEKTEYSYQNIRSKNYFWGDGDKTLFWNDKVNYHKKE